MKTILETMRVSVRSLISERLTQLYLEMIFVFDLGVRYPFNIHGMPI